MFQLRVLQSQVKEGFYLQVGAWKESTGYMFNRFWSAYPKKVAKGEARKAWEKLKPNQELVEKMLATLAWQCESNEWRQEGGQYIPHPASWLRAERWDDEPTVVEPPKPKGRLSIAEQNFLVLRDDVNDLKRLN